MCLIGDNLISSYSFENCRSRKSAFHKRCQEFERGDQEYCAESYITERKKLHKCLNIDGIKGERVQNLKFYQISKIEATIIINRSLICEQSSHILKSN